MLHADSTGKPVSWRAGDKLLRYIHGAPVEGDTTLETGAGLSTLVFVIKRCYHTVIAPDQAQADRILQWCQDNQLPTDRLEFRLESSEKALPALETTPLDFVLIDGAHGFPLPFIDWFYAGRRLRVGGVLAVDDLQIWTGRILLEFLSTEQQWSIDHRVPFEFFAARRLAEGPVGEWLDQPYVLHRSIMPNSTSRGRRYVGYGATGYHLGQAAIGLIREGKWSELRSRMSSMRAS